MDVCHRLDKQEQAVKYENLLATIDNHMFWTMKTTVRYVFSSRLLQMAKCYGGTMVEAMKGHN